MSQWQPRYDPGAHERRARSGQPPQGHDPGTREPWQPQWPPQPQQFPPPGQPPQYPPGPGHRLPPRKRRGRKIAAAITGGFVLLIVVIAVAANSGGKGSPASGSSSGATAAGAPATFLAAKAGAATVTYVVTGSPADVTYGPAGSSLSGSVPMRKTEKLGSKPAAYYSIDAQLSGSGKVTCEVLVSGKVISKASASGEFNIASCEVTQDPFSGQWQDANAA